MTRLRDYVVGTLDRMRPGTQIFLSYFQICSKALQIKLNPIAKSYLFLSIGTGLCFRAAWRPVVASLFYRLRSQILEV